MQQRIKDFGSPVTAQSLKDIASSFSPAGILSGMTFLVDSGDRIKITSGRAITHQGTIISEDEFKYVTIPLTSNAQDYTVYYYHEDLEISGGVPAELILTTGILTADVVKGVILGYVKYPGGGINLLSSHFLQPLAITIGQVKPTLYNAEWLMPINNVGYMVTQVSGGTLTRTDVFDVDKQMYMKIRNDSVAVGTATYTFPFKVKDNAYAKAQIRLATDINTSANFLFVDSVGNVSSALLPLAITAQPTMALYIIDLPRGTTQTPNKYVYLQMQVQMAINREIKVQAVGLTTYNLPY